MRKYKTVTTKEIKEWISLNEQGYNVYEIAEIYGRTRKTIMEKFKIFDIKLSNSIGRPKNEFYKNKYIICIYDMDDQLCWQFNNPLQMSLCLNKSINAIHSILSKNKINAKHRINKKWYKIYLLENN